MESPELAHLELLAEVDTLVAQLDRWSSDAPDWHTAQTCGALVNRLSQRVHSLRIRLESPLVVATLGGTGTGKSSLINALVGSDVAPVGRQRPTTLRPRLICRPDLTPQMLGIDPSSVELVQCDSPALGELVLLDCPDPDTTEETDSPGTNLARLRGLLPHCDVLLVATTQQKYRSARVADELFSAASGARLVFVQTHADTDDDIREDWRQVLQDRYSVGRIFLVDSPAALADAQAGLQPRGEFGELVELLTRQLVGAAGNRIRRANFLDLLGDTLEACSRRIDAALPAVQRLGVEIEDQRARLASRLAAEMRSELLASRRQWESRLVGRITSHWGFSPFAVLLRLFQGLGGLIFGAVIVRARTPAQMALLGAMEGARAWRRRKKRLAAETGVSRVATGCWEESELHSAAVILDGYAAEADVPREGSTAARITAESAEASAAFVERAGVELEDVIGKVAAKHTGWFTRWRYELLLCGMLGFLLYRPGRNFFYDFLFTETSQQPFGLEVYLSSGFWFLAWCGLLLWAFTSRLRRGLRQQVNELAQGWNTAASAAGIFRTLEEECRRVDNFRHQLARLRRTVADLRHRLALPDDRLGHRMDQ